METSVWLSSKAFIAHFRWWFSSVVAEINCEQFFDHVASVNISINNCRNAAELVEGMGIFLNSELHGLYTHGTVFHISKNHYNTLEK